MSLVVKRGGVRQHSQNASRGHGRTRAPGQVRSAYSRGPRQPRAVPCLLARHPSPPLFSCVVGRCLRREGHEELGLALLRVGLERAFGLPLLLDLGFQLEEGVSTRVGLRRGRWGGHGFACFFYACKLERCSLCDCSLACGSSAAMACKEAVVSNLQQLSP